MSLNRRDLIALLPLAQLGQAAGAEAAPPLRIGWGDFPPFQMRAAPGPEGLDIELIELIALAAGERLRWLNLPWARQLSDLAQGELDLVAGATHSPEREAFAEYTQPYRQERVALMALAGGAPALKFLSDLKGRGLRVGIIRGSTVPALVRHELDNPALRQLLVPLYANDLTLSALRGRRVDYVLEDPVTTFYRAARVPGEAVVVALDLMVSPVHLMVSRRLLAQRPDLVQRLNQGLQRARQQPAWGQVLARYPGL